jgi:RNA polymerase primary sigma factor
LKVFQEKIKNGINFFTKEKEYENIKSKLIQISKDIGLPVSDFKILVNKIKKGEESLELLKRRND